MWAHWNYWAMLAGCASVAVSLMVLSVPQFTPQVVGMYE
jgi:hypothetical protein